ANRGQYGQMLRSLGYEGDIISFEPLRATHALLQETAREDPRWHVPEPVAIGAENDTVSMEVAGNVYSSSMLKMAPLHTEAAPESRIVSQEEVTVVRLDEIAPRWMNEGHRGAFLKVDVQGYESHVLDGATGILEDLQGIQMELSLAPLYEGQPDWMDLIQRARDLGFCCESLEPGFTHPSTGRLLQADGVFFRQP
ncbi:MAG: FkbM family methyltransferase, partial [Myxococcota bacterium]|nr:FkbM family methyltransferase [Myxococcota bacterium]